MIFCSMNICNILSMTYICMVSFHTLYEADNTVASRVCTPVSRSCCQPNTDVLCSILVCQMLYIAFSYSLILVFWGEEEKKVYLFGFKVL